jgi:MYXO-CTERM domain-containing protein
MYGKLGRVAFSVGLASLLLGAMPALSDGGGDRSDRNGHRSEKGSHSSRSVPEFDPSTVGAIVALLVGGGALLARRRR